MADRRGAGKGNERESLDPKQKKAKIPAEEEISTCAFLSNVEEVLKCFICYRLLSSPFFHCKNGHTACSSCCAKVKKKCPMCSSPIGDMRNRAIEAVMESLQVSCQNAKYGCKEKLGYNNTNWHERACIYAPCSCPCLICGFVSSSNELSLHFSSQHKGSAVIFTYDMFFKVSLNVKENLIVLQEKDNGDLFVLSNCSAEDNHVGNLLNVSRIAPNSSKFACDYVLQQYFSHRTMGSYFAWLCSVTDNCQGQDLPHRSSAGSLLVPSAFFISSPLIELNLSIGKKTPSRST